MDQISDSITIIKSKTRPAPRRRYTSRLRDAQKEDTRQHILDVLVPQMAAGNFNAVSMAEIAKAAGIGPATLYRHFPSREALWDGLSAEFNRLVGSASLPATPEDISAIVQRDFAVFDQHPGLVQAFFFSELGRAARTRGRARRIQAIRAALAPTTAGLAEAERERVVAVVAYLASLQSWVTMTSEFGLSGEQVGVAVAWAIQTLLAAVKEQ